MKRIGILAVAAVAAVALVPETAHACAVCFSAADENRDAFILTTAFLTFLPLGMVSGAGLWLRHRVKERDAKESAPPEDSSSI
jgi:hypothetical protein